MNSLILAVAAIAAAAPPGGASGGGWRTEMVEGRCAVAGALGGAGAKAVLQRLPGNPAAGLTLSGPGWPARWSRVVLQPSGRALNPLRQGAGAGGAVVEHWSEEATFLKDLAASEAIVLERSGKAPLRLALTGPADAVAALEACEDARLHEWSGDPAALRGLRAAPQPRQPIPLYVKADDYPPEALRSGASGTVTMLLGIGADGRVASCKTVVSSSHAAIDAKSCDILSRRARFTPARDAAGIPVAAPYVTRLGWRLGGAAQP
ncbi:MAG TPA: energy transducer TonB [Allosphingosinicella sp.]|nr:energy transducer TonB [Allosphingosinicella sp.]